MFVTTSSILAAPTKTVKHKTMMTIDEHTLEVILGLFVIVKPNPTGSEVADLTSGLHVARLNSSLCIHIRRRVLRDKIR